VRYAALLHADGGVLAQAFHGASSCSNDDSSG
jgi:hypothetical protein